MWNLGVTEAFHVLANIYIVFTLVSLNEGIYYNPGPPGQRWEDTVLVPYTINLTASLWLVIWENWINLKFEKLKEKNILHTIQP